MINKNFRSNKKRDFLSIITLFLVFSLSTGAQAIVLDVPQKYQEEDQWCWAGVSQAVLAYYGFELSQVEIAFYGTEGVNTWNWLYGSSSNPTRRGIDLILDHFGDLSSQHSDTYLTQTELSSDIIDLRPVIVRWEWDSGGGHFIVARGIETDFVYVMDPWSGPSINSYDWVRMGSSHTWTHTLEILNAPIFVFSFSFSGLWTETDGDYGLFRMSLEEDTNTFDGIFEQEVYSTENVTELYSITGTYAANIYQGIDSMGRTHDFTLDSNHKLISGSYSYTQDAVTGFLLPIEGENLTAVKAIGFWEETDADTGSFSLFIGVTDTHFGAIFKQQLFGNSSVEEVYTIQGTKLGYQLDGADTTGRLFNFTLDEDNNLVNGSYYDPDGGEIGTLVILQLIMDFDHDDDVDGTDLFHLINEPFLTEFQIRDFAEEYGERINK